MQRLQGALSGDYDDCTHIMVGPVGNENELKMVWNYYLLLTQ